MHPSLRNQQQTHNTDIDLEYVHANASTRNTPPKEIQDQNQLVTNHQSEHQIIIVGDFNQDILLKGRTSKDTTSPPNQNDHD